MTAGIYKITNIQNNKCYVGQARDLNVRKNSHFALLKRNKHENSYLQNVYNKYGKEIFIFEIIQELEPNKERLNLMEIYWICYYNSFVDDGGGYNLTRGGDSSLHSEESKKKMSNSMKGKTQTEEHKKRSADARRGKKLCEESRKNVILGLAKRINKQPTLGFKHTEETRRKMSESHSGSANYNFGKTISEEQKEILRKANTGRVCSEETRHKLSESLKGRVFSEESKKKMRKPKSEEHRKNISNARKGNSVFGEKSPHFGKPHSDETKKKISLSAKKRYEKERQEKQILQQAKGEN